MCTPFLSSISLSIAGVSHEAQTGSVEGISHFDIDINLSQMYNFFNLSFPKMKMLVCGFTLKLKQLKLHYFRKGKQ